MSTRHRARGSPNPFGTILRLVLAALKTVVWVVVFLAIAFIVGLVYDLLGLPKIPRWIV